MTDVGKDLTPSIMPDLTRFLDAEDTSFISHLATMCFKMKIYSSPETSSSEAGNESEISVDGMGGDVLLKCDTCERKPDRRLLESVLLKTEKDLPSSVELRQDLEKTRFVRVNFQHLDFQSLKASIIANCLDHRYLLKVLLSCLDGKYDICSSWS